MPTYPNRKDNPKLAIGSEKILINGWMNEEDIKSLSVDDCAECISYLLMSFSDIISYNLEITPRQASNQLIEASRKIFDEQYKHVLGDPDKRLKKEPEKKNHRRSVYTVSGGLPSLGKRNK